ncbi:MAG: hypothetical protein QF741_02820 [Candidatus Peribacteraceae bacterium]|jgi:hypothetical protein|nr:hypothetical protein [Candidatus Peribacteraceae bacterium]MDP7646059.1 hypothetical protein [Candidatus Peribacteraceae bacterium]|tara:strand:+ start:1141 stop:1536 length:396 start_codon:yes stop_codon:yes gene_type:complete
MKRLDRFIPLSLLGILTVALIPVASAQGSFRDQIPESAREELRECKKIETRTERRECAKAVFEKYDIDPPIKRIRRHMKRKIGKRFGHCLRMEDRGEASKCFLNVYDKVKQATGIRAMPWQVREEGGNPEV